MSLLRIYLWVCLSPFIWFILSISPFFIRPYINDAGLWLLLLNLIPILAILLVWQTQQQNHPKNLVSIDPDKPIFIIWIAGILLSVGALILGSELHNIYLDWQGHSSVLNAESGETLADLYASAHNDYLVSWGFAFYFICIRPWSDAFFFFHIFYRNLGSVKNRKIRISITTVIMLIFAWHLGFSSLILCFCWTWFYERVRHLGPLLLAGSCVGALHLWIMIGEGPHIPGFDLQEFAWQPWWFNLLGLLALSLGSYALQSVSPYWVRSALHMWRMMEELKLFSQPIDPANNEIDSQDHSGPDRYFPSSKTLKSNKQKSTQTDSVAVSEFEELLGTIKKHKTTKKELNQSKPQTNDDTREEQSLEESDQDQDQDQSFRSELEQLMKQMLQHKNATTLVEDPSHLADHSANDLTDDLTNDLTNDLTDDLTDDLTNDLTDDPKSKSTGTLINNISTSPKESSHDTDHTPIKDQRPPH